MTHTQQRIEEIRENGYQLNLPDVFDHAFKNYKKTALYAVPVVFVFYLLAYFFGTRNFISLQGNIDSSVQLHLIYMLREVLSALFIALFTTGFLKMADCADKNKKFNVFTIFYYYRLPYLTNIIGAALLISIVKVSVSVWMQTLNLPFLGILISLLITLFTYLTIPLIIFGNFNAVDAIKTGLMVASKQPLMLIEAMVVLIVFFVLGVILSFIRLSAFEVMTGPIPIQQIIAIFIIPFIYSSMTYAVYSSIIGSEIEKPDSNPEISS